MFLKVTIMSLLRRGCLLLVVVVAFYFTAVPVFAQTVSLTGPMLHIKLLETSFEERRDIYTVKTKLRLRHQLFSARSGTQGVADSEIAFGAGSGTRSGGIVRT
jgi:hypothetical protein